MSDLATFNAWRDPWLPVHTEAGRELVALRDLYSGAVTPNRLDPGLLPLEQDSVLRLLVAVYGAVLQAGSIEGFAAAHEDRFNLIGDRPFLQRWDRTQGDLDKVAGSPRILPIAQLHPEEPGNSSRQWAIRQTNPRPGPPELVLRLVVAWHQTKNGLGRDPWKGRAVKGSAGTWDTWPFALWHLSRVSLMATIRSNTPTAWAAPGAGIPIFLDRGPLPRLPDLPANSLTRFTYARTLPLLHVVAGEAVGWVLGEDVTVPLPSLGLGADEKERLGAVHGYDHTRPYLSDGRPRRGFRTSLACTDGLRSWYREDRPSVEAAREWAAVPRAGEPGPGWMLGVLNERTDGKGNREWVEWVELPVAVLVPVSVEATAEVRAMLQLVGHVDASMRYAVREHMPRGFETALASTHAAFADRVYPGLVEAVERVANGEEVDLRAWALGVCDLARQIFAVGMDPFLHGAQTFWVAAAMGMQAALARDAVNQRYAAVSQ